MWKQALGWDYQVFDPNCRSSELKPFESLVEIWQSKYSNGNIPAWRDFSFDDFYGWHGWLRVGDFVSGRTDDFKYRLWGVYSVDLYGVDLTGKNMSELNFGFDEDDKKLLTILAKEKKLTLATGPLFWQDREHIKISIVKFPLADDGQNVDKFLGALFRHSDAE